MPSYYSSVVVKHYGKYGRRFANCYYDVCSSEPAYVCTEFTALLMAGKRRPIYVASVSSRFRAHLINSNRDINRQFKRANNFSAVAVLRCTIFLLLFVATLIRWIRLPALLQYVLEENFNFRIGMFKIHKMRRKKHFFFYSLRVPPWFTGSIEKSVPR